MTGGVACELAGGVACELDGLKKSLIDLFPPIMEIIHAGLDSSRIYGRKRAMGFGTIPR